MSTYRELRLILETEMSETELEQFVEEMEKETKEHLLPGEKVVCSLVTDKVSYESRQLMKELGVE